MAEDNVFRKLVDNVADLTKSIEEITCMDPAVDHINRLVPSKKRRIKRTKGSHINRGIYNEQLIEAEPNRVTTKSEHEIRQGNSWIVLGRDRPSGARTGYGGLGHHRAAAIDICVGPQGRDVSEWDTKKREKIVVNPDFQKDSARIYISAKSDIDENFQLTDGKVGNAKGKSAIGIKADGVRIVGREGVKIITKGGDTKNSRGCRMSSVAGIDLIAGNDDTDLQPLVKGNDLSNGLKQLADLTNSLNGILIGFINSQMQFNRAIMKHHHYSPFFGSPTTPPIDTLMVDGVQTILDQAGTSLADAALNKINLTNWKFNYCEPAGSLYINSRMNNTN
mgnify:CR=1 FL=1|tara:strand:+ start:668 stop:1672 length:1005 start_codon:yes stop_codon:yes gene_type:complete